MEHKYPSQQFARCSDWEKNLKRVPEGGYDAGDHEQGRARGQGRKVDALSAKF